MGHKLHLKENKTTVLAFKNLHSPGEIENISVIISLKVENIEYHRRNQCSGSEQKKENLELGFER